MDLTVNLAPRRRQPLILSNPVMIASGTFGYDGYGRGLSADAPLASLGAVLPKTFTRHPREGNPEPRWFPSSFREGLAAGETTLLNSIGLTNPGIKAAMSDLAPQWAEADTNIVMSMAADSPEQWEEMAAFTVGVAGFSTIELNLSCPNVDDGAMFSHHPRLTEAAVAGVRRQTDMPVWVKLSPNVPDITEIAHAAVSAGADALTISNTVPALHIDVDTGKPTLGTSYGGLSGPALRPIAMALVHKAAQAVDVPIIGVGGVMTGRHAAEYLLAGASAVQVGSANLADLNAPFRILAELEALLHQWEVASVSEIIGKAQLP
ncbi:MAG: dihydroorotate dehydrogenase [Chloroflexi bacterium]|nr:dihydroorotate dehydrogenase [Chloroflexota bacterium]MYD46883.1 dihydroorotate dehydrogenase [Chloroflexota bacterium]